MKWYFIPPAGWFIGIVFLCLSTGGVAYADSGVRMSVNIGNKIVSCDVYISYGRDHLVKALREGTEISVNWEINIDAIRRYWLNRKVAALIVKRRVIPDLVSRSWQLVDMTSGISQRVFDLKRAVQFLTRLDKFPVIDRSLLKSGDRYRMDIKIDETVGDAQRGWMMTWFGSSSARTSAEFVLP